ncbi:MAG: YggT family protein [Thermoleophilia bacterium]
MSSTARVIYIAVVVYMFLILLTAILGRIDPRPGTVFRGVHRVLAALTEPYVGIVRRVGPKIDRGSVDWSAIIAITVLFVGLQVLRHF